MSGKSPSSQYGSGLIGSGALSHVYIEYPPLKCSVTGSRGLYYDDANKLLLYPTSNEVFSWKSFPFDPLVSPAADSVSEGPIVSIRYSLDMKFLAVQRSAHEVEFWNCETGETFSHGCRLESETILGFFWTDFPCCDIVYVKTSGLDLFSCDSKSKSLRLVETKKVNVSWYVYTHESRLVLIALGTQGKNFSGFQLSSAGCIRLPKFEMRMAKVDANSKPVLAAEDVHIVTLYGRIYCLQVDRIAMQLHLYRFYRDAVVQQGSLPIYSSKIAVSVVDNVLLAHQVDAKVVILYDIFADSRAPTSAPLPLTVRGFPHASTSSSSDARASDSDGTGDHEAIIYGDSWTFLVPDLVCDVAAGSVWKINLDLEAVSASCSEVPTMLEFLQRRKLEAHKAKQLCLAILRTIILERRPFSVVARAIDVIVTSYSRSLKIGACLEGRKVDRTSPSGMTRNPKPVTDESASQIHKSCEAVQNKHSDGVEGEAIGGSVILSASDSEDGVPVGPPETSSGELQVTSAAISPDEMYSVFASVEEEMAGDASYLVAIIVEFIRSANVEKIKLNPNHFVLTAQLLGRNQRFTELGSFITNKILEPSKEVALQLLESGRHNLPTRKLGLDMLRQLSLHHDYILLLLQDGYYLAALQYARRNQIYTLQPSLFLDAAFAANDSQHLAAVLRFVSDYIPGFRGTAEDDRYRHILNEMNSAVT